MRVVWTDHQREQWESLHRTAAGPLQQAWAFGEAMRAAGVRCLRAMVFEGEQPVALAQFIGRRIGLVLETALCSRGPVPLQGIDGAYSAAVCRLLRASSPLRRPRMLFFAPDTVQPLPGLRRVLTGWSTIVLDLSQSLEALRAGLHPKWRNRLVAAEREGLRVQRMGHKPAQYGWLIERESAQRASRGYLALPPGFVQAFQAASQDPRHALLGLRIDVGREPVAGMLFLVHGEAATYHLGWSGEQGRAMDAHNLLLWEAIVQLREQGVRRLDLGGVNTASGAGIARFKIGTGGEVLTFSGTWC